MEKNAVHFIGGFETKNAIVYAFCHQSKRENKAHTK